ncbi:acetyl-CoA decarbonylase/synthase complex subunit alpha/beta [Desulfomonile tiedjei]|uniref:CO-methylating acetyl-CoA synthase n=1 Tax=Desulfomonile tiedjei (strain ATCC 49306 / DSM 6799 / DCB-1) TaxID=706587 RepID=I4C086_DESTA|nr:acetyl-CoA decarbonylase/synthase complex subunit alpha/beta [Desulfomonile tiedjei]AFM22977.1 acetyl-CoA decarbonylase/synthase beta subunit [Desulfomonile tiedjei DSM 6799]
MSKIIAANVVAGAHKVYEKARKKYEMAVQKYGKKKEISFPNTGYYLPVIYGILGFPVKNLGDAGLVLDRSEQLIPPLIREKAHLPYLGPILDAGMASLFNYEIIEAIRYLEEPDFYLPAEDPTDDKLWLGAADDVILRKRGVEFVDGTAPGFAAIVGSAPTKEIAAEMALELQKKNLYVFMAAQHNGTTFSQQLREAGVQIGWPTRLVPFGPDISSAIFAVGFATRAALSFGGIEPGDFRKVLIYNKDRVFAFVLAMGDVSDEWYAAAAGCINYGFPTIADTPIPQILPTGVCTYEHVVSNIPHQEIVAKAIEVRGLKVTVTEVPVPTAYGPAFEGERIRGEDIYMEAGGGKTQAVELTVMKDMNEVEDGKIEVIGPDLKDIEAGTRVPLGILVEVAGRKMQSDFEPILERQIHHLINYAQGLMHIGQRDIAWVRIGKGAVEKGFSLSHIGSILHAKLHQDFGSVLDKVQVKVFTEKDKVDDLLKQAREVYAKRDARVEGMTDEDEPIFYSCTLCQSFAPSHVCVVTPERTGLCGAYNWLDCKASFEINPTGPNQPIEKGKVIDERLGQWEGVNEFVQKASRGKVVKYNAYSIMEDPMTSCGCFECIAAVLPVANGVMTVDRDYKGPTPCGMKFTTLAGSAGGGNITPGFVGHSKLYIGSKKFVAAEGGILRLVWMPKALKEMLKEKIDRLGAERGVSNLSDRIADETVGVTEDEIYPFLQEKEHPAVSMDSIVG